MIIATHDVGPEDKFIKEKYNKKLYSILIQKKQDVKISVLSEILVLFYLMEKVMKNQLGLTTVLENVPKDITKMVAGNLNVDGISN